MKIRYLFSLILLFVMSCSSGGDDTSMPNASGSQNTGDMTDNSGNDGNTNTEETTYQGSFVSSAHETSGEATVNQDKTILSFTDFKTENGPILEVYLATDANASDYISLGVLQGLEGNFDYELPEGVNFETHKYVIIWCVDFLINFGYAVLQ